MRGLACLLAVTTACTTTTTHWRSSFHPPSQPPPPAAAPFLACHTSNGSLYVLGDWHLAHETQVLHGTGLLYDARRELRQRGTLEVPLSSVALLEATGAEALDVPTGGLSPFGWVAIAAISAVGAFLTLFVVAFVTNPPGT